VRERPEGGGYWLIAGERRWRAAQRAGLHEIPAVVREATPAKAFEMALVENLQRDDLNPIEEAEAYRRLSDEHGLTQDQLADRVGKDRTTITNALRLLKLPQGVRALVTEGSLGMGHARALLGLEDPAAIDRFAKKVAERQLSVRATEELVRRERSPAPGRSAAAPAKSASVRDLEQRLTRSLGARVAIHDRGGQKGGKIEISYANLDDLDRLLDRLARP
jgi:ParB family chromosome partitioning protein